MQRAQTWRRGTAILLAVWCVALPVIWVARANKPTAEKTVAFVETHPLESKSADERMRIVEDLADQLNHLNFDDRQKVQFGLPMHRYYQQMSEAERARYWRLTLRPGLQQMIEAFSRKPPEERSRLLNRALSEIDRVRQDRQDLQGVLADKNRDWIVHEGLMKYFTDTDATTKLELQPVVEQVQNMAQMGR